MSRTRQTLASEGGQLTELQWDYLNDAIPADDPRRQDDGLAWRFIELDCNFLLAEPATKLTSDLWTAYRDQILARWVKERPGTRPTCWWRFEAPPGSWLPLDGWWRAAAQAAGGTGEQQHAPPVAEQPVILARLGKLTPPELASINKRGGVVEMI